MTSVVSEDEREFAPCSVCDTPNPPGAEYCDGCGIKLGRAQQIPDATPPETVGNGRYRVERLLGEGANKHVYLAHDTVLDRDVALSLIKGDGFGFWRANPAATARMLEEARVMARLGDHPHLVSVYDMGDEGARTYLVCQLMTGGDLQDLLEQVPERRLALNRALAITDQILQGLACAHEHGIIHRDIKPANIWLTREGAVKIGDLGLAMARAPSGLDLATAIVGTVAFMAPEQAVGQVPDERSDLYAVGAVLYAMLAGRPPFLGDDSVAVIDQHLHASPVALRWFNPTVPAAVESFVLRLLAKEPQLRPQSARAARAELQAITWSIDHETPNGPSAATRTDEGVLNPLDGVATEVFVGRRREMDLLRGLADAAFGGDGKVLLVGGEAGIGKTRLARELATYARMRGAEVLWGGCREDEGTAYAPWVQILGALVRTLDFDSLEELAGRRGGDLARILPSLVERLPGLKPPPELDAEQSRRRLYEGVSEFLCAAADRRPLVVVLDDVHWADAASLQLLLSVAESVGGARLLLVALFREEGAARVAALLPGSAEGSRFEWLSLEVLSPEEVERLVTLALGWDPDGEWLRSFYRSSAGNPLFAGEVLRLLSSEGTLGSVTPAVLETLLPDGVHGLLRRRVGLLTPAAQELLELAAILGAETAEAVLRRLASRPIGEFERALAEVEAARLLVRSTEDRLRGSLRFSHALLRATVLADLAPERRADLHLRAAEVLETGGETQGGDGGPSTAEIASHLAEALPLGDPAKAASYSLLAGGEAIARFAWEEAVRLFERGLDTCRATAGCAPHLEPSLAEGLGDASVALALRGEGIAAYERALASPATDRHSAPRLNLKIARAHVADRHFAEAGRAFDRALAELPAALARDTEDWQLWTALQLSRAEAFYHAGLLQELGPLLETLGPLVERHGTPRQRADLLAATTMFILRGDRYRPGPTGVTAASAELEARRAFDPDGSGLAGAHFRLGFVHLLRDEFEPARAHLDAAERTARDIGDRVRETQALVYLSQLERGLGRVQAASAVAKRAWEAAVRAGLPGYAAAAQSDLAWVLLREGHRLEAREQAGQALKTWGSGSTWPFEWLARFPLAAVAAGRGSLGEVGGHLEALLHPAQQLLPGPLTRAMERALEVLRGEGEGAAEAVEVVLGLAREGNYA